MFCRNCGVKLEEDAVFCQNCGTRVEEKAAENKKGSRFQEYRSEVKSEMKDGVKNLFATGVIVLVAVAITWAILNFTGKDSGKTETAVPQVTAAQSSAGYSTGATQEYRNLLNKYGYGDVSLFEDASSMSYLREDEYGLCKIEYVHDGQYVTDLIFYNYWDVSYETTEEIRNYVETFYEGTYFVGDKYYVTVNHYENMDEESGLQAFYNPAPGETVEKITIQDLNNWMAEEAAVYIR